MKSNIEFLYEELRKATDGGSESMTHDDALKQIAYWRDECSQAQEPVSANHRTTGWVAPVNRYAVPVLFNPYTGEPRDVRDVQSDPQGVLIVPPGKAEMLAAKPTVESVTDCMMNLVDRLGHEASDVDARAWEHLLVYAPKQAQAVEPVATVQCVRGVTFGYLDVMQPVGTKLYLHPAPTPAEAQQVAVLEKREPLNRVDILNMHALRCWPRTMFADKSYGIALDTVTVVDFVRIIEAHHGIGAKP